MRVECWSWHAAFAWVVVHVSVAVECSSRVVVEWVRVIYWQWGTVHVVMVHVSVAVAGSSRGARGGGRGSP